MRRLLACFLRDERGVTAIEYSLIAGGIAVAIAAIVFTVGSDLTSLFDHIGTVAASFTPS